METTTIRIGKDTHNLLKNLSEETHKSMNLLINEMSIEYQKKVFWNQVNASYAKLKEDKEAWAEELEERKLWENTLGDGLE